jgi:NAD(P)-dependent dehydrogenase (short-subunit alcohol dehydrogenase family)
MNNYYSEKFSLSGKIALLVGGAGGIGKEIALGFAKSGANIIIADYNIDSAQEIVKLIDKEEKRSLAISVDITNSESVKSMANKIISTFGAIDILINLAGVGKSIPAEETTDEEWNRVININLSGTFFCCREIGKLMIKQHKGVIVNIASMSATIVNKGRNNAHYCASKGGVKMLTKALAAQWAKYNIRVNSISPGYIQTQMTKDFLDNPNFSPYLKSFTPMERPGKPEELVGLAIFLSSDASSFMTGSDILIDGGYTIF